MTSGEKIRNIRQRRGLTAKHLGEKCGMLEASILRIEKATQYPRQDTLTKIANALGVSIEELYPDDSIILPAVNDFNEILRQHIISCVQTIDDRQTLLHMAIDIEKILTNLAEKENNTPCE